MLPVWQRYAHGLSFYKPDEVLEVLDGNFPATLPLRRLPEWSPDMEAADTLHNLWLGPCKDAVEAILLHIVEYHPDFAGFERNP